MDNEMFQYILGRVDVISGQVDTLMTLIQVIGGFVCGSLAALAIQKGLKL